jgi:acyl-CoA synthetase (AMP-forming)/AMP-acid ligase II
LKLVDLLANLAIYSDKLYFSIFAALLRVQKQMGLDNFLRDLITEEDSYAYTLPEILNYRAENTPHNPAFIFLKDGEDDEDRITYQELDRDARAIAKDLSFNILKGERALLLFPPGLDYIRALFACFYAGIIAIPAYPPRKNRSIDRLKALVMDSGTSLVLTTGEIRQTFQRLYQDIEELKSLILIAVDDLNHSSEASVFPSWSQDDIALLQYTSGSTGQPKGVIITHRNIMRNCEFIRNSFSFSTKSVGVSWLPTFHDMGLVGQVFQPVYTGFPSVYMAPVSFFQKPVRWLKAFSKYKGTMGGAPNFAFDLLSENTSADELDGLDLSSIKTIYCGAEPIRRSTLENFLDVYKDYGLKPEMLYTCFGMAETTLITTGPPAGRGPKFLGCSGNGLLQNKVIPITSNNGDTKHLVGVGYPWLDNKIRIVNPDTFQSCKTDEVGEIWIAGTSVSPGYWNKPDVNREIFEAEIEGEPGARYFRSGDLGFIHEGELYISGRLKDLIIIHGVNIYPQDIEYFAENSHTALRPNASAAFSVESGGEERLAIVAEVERSAMMSLDVTAVCDAIRENVAIETELVVHSIQLLRPASILKTSSGKIQRRACKEAFIQRKLEVIGESFLESQSHEQEQKSTAADLVSLEAWLMTWIHEKLRTPMTKLDPARPITAYGLNSMKAIALQQDFLDKYGVNLPPYLFFEKVPIRQMCEKVLKLIPENKAN